MGCTSHRFCTCNIVCGCNNHCGAYGYAGVDCGSNREKTGNINYDTKNGASPVLCYTYLNVNSSSCITYGSGSCAPHTGRYNYNCPGHRDYGHHTSIPYDVYGTGSIIDNHLINIILEYIRTEISERKAHAMYKNESLIQYTESDVPQGMYSYVYASLPNKIHEALDKLRSRITSLPDYKDYPTDTYGTIKSTVSTGKIAYASLMKKLESDLFLIYHDCICYTDCTAYGLWYYNKCTCNINCKCNYSDERLKTSIIYIKLINLSF